MTFVTPKGPTSKSLWRSAQIVIALWVAGRAQAADVRFTAMPPAVGGVGTYYIAADHLDTDPYIDVVSADFGSKTLTVYHGQADCSFQTVQTLPAIDPIGVAIGDFNCDGLKDVACANFNGSGQSSISIYAGQIGGVFSPTADLVVPVPPKNWSIYGAGSAKLVTSDLDDDGKPDLICANYNDGASLPQRLGTATVLFSRSVDHSFSFENLTLDVGPGPSAVSVGDFNHDGAKDIFANNYHGWGQWAIGVATDRGREVGVQYAPLVTNATASRFCLIDPSNTLGFYPNWSEVGDFDGDGFADVLVQCGGYLSAPCYVVLLSRSGGHFEQHFISDVGDSAGGMVAGDFDRDGLDDVLAQRGSLHAGLYLSNGDGTFKPAIAYDFDIGLSVAADVNNDGALDVIASTGNGIRAFVQEIDTTAPTITAVLTPAPNSSGWNNTDVGATLFAQDDQSGIESVFYRQGNGAWVSTSSTTVNLGTISSEGDGVVQFYARDNAGNASVPNPASAVRIDKTPPQTDFQTTASTGGIRVTLLPTDGLSGIAHTYYDAGNGPQTYTVPFVVAAGQSVSFWSTDNADNVEPHNSKLALLHVTIRLVDSFGNPLAGGSAQYYSGSWRSIGTTGNDGTTSVELSPGTFAFAITYKGAKVIKYQNVSSDLEVGFQTVATTVRLLDSNGNAVAGGLAQFYAGTWQPVGSTGSDGQVSTELLPGAYTFAMTFKGGRVQKNQNIALDPLVSFSTTRVTVRLLDSQGNPQPGGLAQFYGGSWQTIGTTGSDGTVTTELMPMGYAFAMTYRGTRIQKNQDVSMDAVVTFQASHVTVRLTDSQGNPLAGGLAQFYAGSWQIVGTTGADGTASCDLLGGSYTFSVDYLGGRVQKIQDISANPMVGFQTARVHSSSGSCTSYYGGSWRTFSNDMELLPTSYTFKFNDGTPNAPIIVTGPLTTIH